MSIYACSDFHGFRSLYGEVKKIIKPEDTVYFLGDAGDRGPHGWELIKDILNDKQWVYIQGNHDYMFWASILAETDEEQYEQERLHFMNGGRITRKAYIDDRTIGKFDILLKLQKSPYYKKVTNKNGLSIFLSHSGRVIDEYSAFNPETFVWDRAHFYTPYEKSLVKGIDLIVHGHTPIPHLINELNFNSYMEEKDVKIEGDSEFIEGRAFFYDHRYKVDLDNLTIQTGKATLLNLDTLESYPLTVAEEEQEFLWSTY